MDKIYKITDKNLTQTIQRDGVGILATDTLYGLVGSAFSKKAVARIYKLKKRNQNKPFIILISSIEDLEKFEIEIDAKTKKFLQKNWPGPVSVILPCPNRKFKYLHRGQNSLAFRWPKKKSLIELLKKTGPLVAPSANPEGDKPAENIITVQKYFGDEVDFYVQGKVSKFPSSLVKIEKGKVIILRKGTKRIE